GKTATSLSDTPRALQHRDKHHHSRRKKRVSWTVVSGTIVKAIQQFQMTRQERGEPVNLSLEAYEALATNMNDSVDIFK
ncbi:unnamed protein product, partial [Pylaiella littoralis]